MFSCIGTDVVQLEIFQPILRIISPVMEIGVGESYQFEYVYFDETGSEATINPVWNSSDESILMIDDNGMATAIEEGGVIISLSFENVTDEVSILVSSESTERTSRTGVFAGYNNYQANGTAVLPRRNA